MADNTTKKKNNRLIKAICLLLGLGVLIGAYFIVKGINAGSEDTTVDETEDNSVLVNTFDASSMATLSYEKNGETVEFETNANSEWLLTADNNYPLNTTYVSTMATNISSLSATRKIENGDVDSFGFDNPVLTVKATYNDGNSLSYIFGATNDFNSNVYMKDESDGSIYLVESSVTTSFDYTVKTLLNADSLPTDMTTGTVTAITVCDSDGVSNTVIDETGVDNLYNLYGNLDFAVATAEYIDEKTVADYGITDSSAYIDIAYVPAATTVTNEDGTTSEVEASTSTFRFWFGDKHDGEKTVYDDNGVQSTEAATVYYYTVDDSKVVYSVDESTYEEIMSYTTYIPEETTSDAETTVAAE